MTRGTKDYAAPWSSIKEQLAGPDAGLVSSEEAFPASILATGPGIDLSEWCGSHAQAVTDLLSTCGAVRFSGFGIFGPEMFRSFADALLPGPIVEYREPATPRSEVGHQVFTSTEFDRTREIFPHGENAHVLTFPGKLLFHCDIPADVGGQTSITDCRMIWNDLSEDLKSEFTERGVLYQRAFGYGLGFRWQDVFGTNSRDDAERYFTENEMNYEWDGDRLRVRFHRWAVLGHPDNGLPSWFNNALFYSPRSLDEKVGRLVQRVGIDCMPHSSFWGDGSEFDVDTLDLLFDLYRRYSVDIDWHPGDVLILDNVAVAHGRRAYEGKRVVHVLMKDLLSSRDLCISPTTASELPQRG